MAMLWCSAATGSNGGTFPRWGSLAKQRIPLQKLRLQSLPSLLPFQFGTTSSALRLTKDSRASETHNTTWLHLPKPPGSVLVIGLLEWKPYWTTWGQTSPKVKPRYSVVMWSNSFLKAFLDFGCMRLGICGHSATRGGGLGCSWCSIPSEMCWVRDTALCRTLQIFYSNLNLHTRSCWNMTLTVVPVKHMLI